MVSGWAWRMALLTASCTMRNSEMATVLSSLSTSPSVSSVTDHSIAEPLSRTVDGQQEPVPYNEYRMLRWSLGQLPANGAATVSARARVEEVQPPVPKAPAAPAGAAPKPLPASR